MSKNVILKQNQEVVLPITKYENVIGAPEITGTITKDGKVPTSKAVSDYVDEKIVGINTDLIDSSIHIGDTEPEVKTRLWIDTTDDNLEKVESQSAVIESIQSAIYALQQKVSKLMLLRTNGIISGSVTDGTLTELGNANEPQKPKILEDLEESLGEETEDENVVFPAYAAETEPTVNHVSIKMGTYQEIQNSRRFFINGELVWCTDRKTMYIYVNGSFFTIASSGSQSTDDDFNYDTMDTTELQQYLDNLDHINFIPLNKPNSKYTVRVNEYGNLMVYDASNDLVSPTPTSRGLYKPGYSEMGSILINSFYLGGSDTDEHSYQACSHNFVELANITYTDINLNGLCLMYTYDDALWFKLPLWGVIKAQSTFLIRGAQCSVMDANTTKIKVKTFDLEWYHDGKLIKFDRGRQKAAFYLCWCDPDNKIYLMHDVTGESPANIKENYPSQRSDLIDRDNGKAALGYIDLIGVGAGESKSGFNENNSYVIPNNKPIDENTLFVRNYSLDPVTQSNPKGISKRNNVKYWRHINLDEVVQQGVEAFTPKASFENKNLSTDKSKFDPNKPNTVTCSFGIQATYKDASHPATRCFNWNSVGYYDEYVWYKKKSDSQWNRVESYKNGVDYTSVEFGRDTDPACIKAGYTEPYKRIRWETFYGAPMTTHKVMITGLTAGVYEYKVGRADEQGNPTDYVSKTREFTVKANSEVTSFDFIQTTDQQAGNWEEYEVWGLSADFISRYEREGMERPLPNNQKAPANENDFDFTINTGDICYNGSRPNEWIDYYNGYSYLDDKEEMFTIGNNDLAPVPEDARLHQHPELLGMTILGYGRERPDKVNHVVADLFYTQEAQVGNYPEFKGTDINGNADKWYRIPSLYSFNYGDFHFISLNSEIRTYFGDDEASDVETTVTGEFGVKDTIVPGGNAKTTTVYSNVEDWLVRDLLIWKNNGSLPNSYDPQNPKAHRFDPQNCQKAIIYTHEMPFTIVAAATYYNYLTSTGSIYRETAKANLNRKHDFQFQRLFKIWGIRLVFGGHKHTCSISMPVYDAPESYVPWESTNEELMAPLSGAETFDPIMQVVANDNDSRWGLNAKLGYALDNFGKYRGKVYNSTNSSVTATGTQRTATYASHTVTDNSDSEYTQKPLCRYEIVDSISAPTYVMCQATGYKNLSNSDTSDTTARCQWQRALVPGSTIDWEDANEHIKSTTPTDQLRPFYTRFRVTSDKIYVDMRRVDGLYTPSSKAGYWNANRDMPEGHDAKVTKLFSNPWESCEISLN